MQTNSRLDYIDIAKGFAITLMVFGHSYSPSGETPVMVWVYSFHMPLFFLTTGILYGLKSQEHKTISFDLKKKCETLLLPYFLWNTLYQLFISILAIIGGTPAKDALIHNLRMVILFNGSAMWFLPAMFISSLVFLKTANSKSINIFIVFFTTLIGLFVPKCNEIVEVFLRSFVGLAYIAIGFYAVKFYSTKYKKFYTVILFAISLLLAFSNGIVSIASRTFQNPVLYMINGCLGTFIIYQVAMHIKRGINLSRLFEYWGVNSIKILCLHGFVIQIIRLLDYKFFNNLLPSFGSVEGFIHTALIMTILTIMMPLINKIFNWSFGVKNVSKTNPSPMANYSNNHR
ncbi:MAG: acyltransferase family protein [Lachnospiraceae bacterium]|nr:acyltransferase family protein [Lachnospiraceae bacterium]